MNFKVYIFSFLQFVIFFLSLVTNWYIPLVITFFVIAIIMMLDKLGKGIVLRETIALHSIFVYLVMPVAGYEIFDGNNALTRIWVKVMPVNQATYFDFCLPAVAGFVLTLCFPINGFNKSDMGIELQRILQKAKALLQVRPYVGIYLMAIGTVMFNVFGFFSTEFQFASLLLYFSSFAGFLYVYYIPFFRFKFPILILFSIFILLNAVSSGMFTIIAYMGLTLFSFFFLGRQSRLWKKILWFCAGVFFLLVLQMAKPAYRKITWGDNFNGNKTVLFSDIFIDKLTTFNLKSTDAFFPVYVRANQGFNVALVMRRIPKVQKHDNGSRLSLSFASAWVPRVFWPDKPEAGGRFNMEYYTGYIIEGWSTNVGPLGEAYGSFGVTGGIIFMIFLGVFIRSVYRYVIVISRKTPLLLLWIPVLFYQVTYSAETDTLQIMNSLVKSAFFIWILYKALPGWFGKYTIQRKPVNRSVHLANEAIATLPKTV